MGMPIEDIILELEEAKEYPVSNEAINYALDTIHKYLLMQSDYEKRLKADLVAMLTEIQMEIEESENCGKAFHLGLQMASNIIQQKINAIEGKINNEDQ